MTAPPPRTPPIAVVGVGALFPGSSDISGFWRDILGGVDRITDVPATHWLPEDYYDPDPAAPDRTYARRGAFLSPVPFDPLEFGVPPAIVPATDTAQLLALLVARAALRDHAGGPLPPEARARTSVILGVTSGQELLGTMVSRLQRPVWVKALRELGWPEDQIQAACERIAGHYVPWVESTFPGLLGNVVAGRIANRFDLGGTNLVTDAACASTFAALHAAIHELAAGDADLVLTGGVDTSNDIFMFTCFSKTPALSPTGDCRPFSAAADGTMLGEGLGMLVLKRLADAERDGDRIHAVIRGVGTSSDGRAKSIYAPVSEGQARALRRAYAAADIDPATVELVEAHGTGTVAGDLAEFRGLQLVFRPEDAGRTRWCALGSIKSQIGHTKAAAGAAGLLKAILALRHRVLPPTIKVDRPDPRLGLDSSAFYLNTAARPWIASAAHPRRAGVSSFGFGGTNFHVVVEEYAGPAPKALRENARPGELVLLSEGTAEALAAACRDTAAAATSASRQGAAAVRDAAANALAWLARASQRRFDRAAPARLAVVARDPDELAALLRAAADALATGAPLPPAIRAELAPPAPGGLALACPGQGSQYVGMGAGLALHFEPARRVWDEAAACLPGPVLLHDVAFPPPAFTDAARAEQRARLTATEWAQPALAAAGAAALAVLRACGVRPDAAFGHSFGELTALHAAGALDLAGLLRAARARGEAMRDAAKVPGAMSAVTGSIEQVAPILAAHPDVVLANHNAPQQVVLAGPTAAVERAEADLRAAGLPLQRLAVATAFHSPVVAPARDAFAAALAEFPLAPPRVPVLSCSEVADYPADPAVARAWLSGQLARPVRFVDQVEALYARGVRTFVELGPGSVLGGLVARCLAGRPHRVVALDDRLGDPVLALLRGLGDLAVAGVALDLEPLWQDLAPPAPPEPATGRLTLSLCGANYGKPYPPPGGAAALPPPNPPSGTRPGDHASPGMFSETSAIAPPATPHGARPPAPSTSAVPPDTRPVPAPSASAPPVPPDTRPAPAPSASAPPVPPDSRRDPAPSRPTPLPSTLMPARPAAPPPAIAPDASALSRTSVAAASVAPGPSTLSRTPVPPEPMSTPPSVSAPTAAWLDAHREIFGQLAAAQSAYQRAMADSHLAYLQVAHASLAALHGVAPAPLDRPRPDAALAAPSPPPPREPPRTDPTPRLAPPLLAAGPVAAPWPVAPDHLDPAPALAVPAARPEDMSSRTWTLPSAGGSPRPSASAPPPPPAADPAALGDMSERTATTAPARAVDPAAVLLAVVADRTGYPADMLRLDMALESDLGIDSIKRVEILSALREKLPTLPDLPPSALGDLRTLGHIAALLSPGPSRPADASAGAPTPASASPPPARAPAHSPVAPAMSGETPAAAPPVPAVDPAAVLLAVVADRTGYPADMLRLDMALESDLGIDSIKRVEILSALRERIPALPDLPPGALGDLRTLGHIAALLSPETSRSTGAPAPASARHDLSPEAPVEVAPARPAAASAPVLDLSPRTPDPTRPAPAPAPAAIGRHVPRLHPAPAAGFRLPHLDRGPVVVTDDGGGIADALAVELRAHGLDARVVADPARLPDDAGALIVLDGLHPTDDLPAGLAACARTLAFARAFAPRAARGGVAFVTVQDTGGRLGLAGPVVRPGFAGLAAFTKTAAREWPAAVCRAIDVARAGRPTGQVARDLSQELIQGGLELELGLSADGGRWTVHTAHEPVDGTPVPLAADGVWVVTGGARGITPGLAEALARRGVRRLVLLGRTAVTDDPPPCVGVDDDAGLKRALLAAAGAIGPAELRAQVQQIERSREVRRALARLEGAGAEVRYLAVDLLDRPALAAALAEVRAAWGPITGLVHAAGVLADRAIEHKTDAEFARVLATKIEGLESALAATAGDPLRTLLVFSSIAARTGNPGQADYAAANEILNKLARAERARRGDACLVKALGWGPWRGGMVTPELARRFAARGVPLIEPDDGAELLLAELTRAPADDVEVVLAALEPGLGDMSLRSEAELHLDAGFAPDLGDHAPGDVPVVPIALAVEWFARAVAAARPGRALARVRDLKVLRGLKLPRLRGGGHRLRLTLQPVSGDSFTATLADESGAPGIRAELACGPLAALPASQAPLGPTAGYGGPLFHGPAFRVLGLPERLDPARALAPVAGVLARAWPGPFATDPAALDGALQLALLWLERAAGGRALPLAIAGLDLHAAGPWPTPARCDLQAGPFDRSRGTCSIDLTTEDGRPLASLTGVELVVYAGGRDHG